jgi:hypothetical protein
MYKSPDSDEIKEFNSCIKHIKTDNLP